MKNVFELIITTPLGYILSFIYSIVKNYGVAIIIFTLVVKACMVPLFVKQQKSMVQMQKLKPQMDAIQKKYANNKEKLNEETMKLYKQNGVNPAGGCLPLLIQFPIIIGLYQVIIRPLQYIMHLSTAKIAEITTALTTAGLIDKAAKNVSELTVAKTMAGNLGLLQQKLGEGFSHLVINFQFLGLDLSQTPSLSKISILWLIPILSALTAYISGVITTKLSGNQQQAEQMKSMNIIMPLMSGYFCFIMPTGVGIYWIMSNLVQIVQQYVITKIMLKHGDENNA